MKRKTKKRWRDDLLSACERVFPAFWSDSLERDIISPSFFFVLHLQNSDAKLKGTHVFFNFLQEHRKRSRSHDICSSAFPQFYFEKNKNK
jgi:hypothetical protein